MVLTAERGSVTDKARRSMRFLCSDLYEKHEMQFEDMLQQLHVAPNTLQLHLEQIMANVFSDEVRAGSHIPSVLF